MLLVRLIQGAEFSTVAELGHTCDKFRTMLDGLLDAERRTAVSCSISPLLALAASPPGCNLGRVDVFFLLPLLLRSLCCFVTSCLGPVADRIGPLPLVLLTALILAALGRGLIEGLWPISGIC